MDTLTKLKNQNYSISGLYYNYKKTSDEEILKFLSKTRIVRNAKIDDHNLKIYYPLDEESLNKIIEKPRGVSLTFDASGISNQPIDNLIEYKKITYLVKSTSRFFLKPDIGEIIDQITYEDRNFNDIKAICFINEYELLPDTEGEHFLMEAILLK